MIKDKLFWKKVFIFLYHGHHQTIDNTNEYVSDHMYYENVAFNHLFILAPYKIICNILRATITNINRFLRAKQFCFQQLSVNEVRAIVNKPRLVQIWRPTQSTLF